MASINSDVTGVYQVRHWPNFLELDSQNAKAALKALNFRMSPDLGLDSLRP